MGSADSSDGHGTRTLGNVGTVGGMASPNNDHQVELEEDDQVLEERVFQTKWENDCLIKAYTATAIQNLSMDGAQQTHERDR